MVIRINWNKQGALFEDKPSIFQDKCSVVY